MARFFKVPRHYQTGRQIYSVSGMTRTPAPQVNDNDYRTSSTGTTYAIDLYGETPSVNTMVNWIFVKGSGIDSYTVTVPLGKGTGTGVTDRVIPSTVTVPEGSSISTTVDGIQHDLLDLSSLDPDGTLNCIEAQITFTGTDVVIYELMFLESVLELDPERSFIQGGYTATLRDNIIVQTNIRGVSNSIKSLSSRPKWNLRGRVLFDESQRVRYNEFMSFRRNNRNFVFSEQYVRYPERVYPATWGSADITQTYYTRRISSGITADFVIQEA